MRIAVAGGTGWAGRLVVDMVRAGGDTPVVLARSTGVDLTTGEGLTAALTDVSAVIDVSNVITNRRSKSEDFFARATANLLAAEQAAGIAHHVVLSIVGIDRVDLGYYYGKRRQEELALNGPVPVSVLRTTQFHEFAAQMMQRGSGAMVFAPKMSCQPIAAREVAAALVTAARSQPAGRLPELAGPEPQLLPDMIRRLARARGSKKLVVPMRIPGAAGKAMARGALLPMSDGPRGEQTFDQWLAVEG